MCFLLKHIIVWLVLVSLSSCTDLLAVYQHNLLLLRNVDSITPSQPLSWESLVLRLPKQLSYPVGLAADPDRSRLFLAEGLPNDGGKIFSISLYSDYTVESMIATVNSSLLTLDEGMSYNPKSQELFWTDAYNHQIFKAAIPEKLDDKSTVKPEMLNQLGVVMEPRGLAIDTCNEWLYWSERGKSRKHPSSIEMCDLSGNRHQVLKQNQDKEYFQSLVYDAAKESLVFGVTLGDEDSTSSCRFTRRSVKGEQSQDLLDLDNCYPFSLGMEQDIIYWADWGRQGIMRANVSDPKSVVKLVHTPVMKDHHGTHNGAFGLVLWNTAHIIPSNSCRAHSNNEKIVEPEGEKGSDNSGKLTGIIEHEKLVEKNGSVKVTTPKKIVTESENITANFTKLADIIKPEHFPEEIGSLESEIGETHLNGETEHMIKDSLKFKEENSEPMKNDMILPEDVSPAIHTHPDTLENKLQSVYDKNSMNGTKICNCNERQLVIFIIVLAVLCVIFMASTVILLGRLFYRRRNNGATQVTVPHPRQVKRFGPKKRFNSGNKSEINGVSPCSGLGSGDGVTINIEDCCQMTLCETPCYTSVKKEGKSYKINVNNTKSCEDKRSLLDNCEEVCSAS
ncbi:hypothetical protein Pmani_020067 [Petrolisthes manimaculis]|uniref:Protein cueball n=1 Tax=Petrolisthes manimaculis TaxID=1843537 RepID=A0AAE1PGF1_9EUCA|nr:hypothetical protein Pmani_020067 [Petrolisthes manimaculis]